MKCEHDKSSKNEISKRIQQDLKDLQSKVKSIDEKVRSSLKQNAKSEPNKGTTQVNNSKN